MKELQQIVRNWVDDRPTMKAYNTKEVLIDLLRQEVNEAEEANPDEFAWELADIVFFTIALANMNNIDLEEAIREKAAFNSAKYQSKDFQSGDYIKARQISKLSAPEIQRDFKI